MADRAGQLAQGGQPLVPEQGLLRSLNVLDHLVEHSCQHAYFVGPVDGRPRRQIAAGDVVGRLPPTHEQAE